jgi:ABC-2 type transport system ATP-binding protein
VTERAIEVRRLSKQFDGRTAVADVSFDVAAGTLVGLLGPNGAGKTTTINCLTTLLVPDGGTASVAGHDVVRQPDRVRAEIAVTGQFAALDDVLSGRENLVLFGRLLRLGKADARRRADELLERFDLQDAAGKPVKSYSGGMRRRLDLAASLVVERRILFLDEPTTGLDPRSREELWQIIRRLREDGSTIVLTSQYLEEVDRLADRVVVIDVGRVIADGTVDELKERVGGQVCEVEVVSARRSAAAEALASHFGDVRERDDRLVVPAQDPHAVLEVVKALEDAEVGVENLTLRKPSLDEVFFALTGGTPRGDAGGPDSVRTADRPGDGGRQKAGERR